MVILFFPEVMYMTCIRLSALMTMLLGYWYIYFRSGLPVV